MLKELLDKKEVIKYIHLYDKQALAKNHHGEYIMILIKCNHSEKLTFNHA